MQVLDTPPPKSPTITQQDWVAILAVLRTQKGKAVLLPEFTEHPNARSLYIRINRPIRAVAKALAPGERLTVYMRNSRPQNGRRVGDVWLMLEDK